MDRQTKVLVTLLIVSLAVGMLAVAVDPVVAHDTETDLESILVAVESVGALADGEYTVSTILAEFEVMAFRGFPADGW